jgi:hypothetical protein
LSLENVDSQKSEIESVQAEDHRRSERRLGRGLEDVSHLFLSQPDGRPAEKLGEPDTSFESTIGVPDQPKSPLILRASPALNLESLVSLLNIHTAILEEGMHAIDTGIPCDPYGPVNLLAVDATERLVIIDVDTVQNNELLLRGIAHFDWFVCNNPIIRRMYHGHTINFSTQPRLFLAAPGFSALFKCAARRSICPQVSCLIYRTVATPGGPGIFFERA